MSNSPKITRRTRWLIASGIAAGVLLFAAANAHLVYVAVTSQPDCVAHLKESGAGSGRFRAAASAC